MVPKRKHFLRGNLYLVGFMGVGKSTVGRVLAGRLGVPVVDLDEVIEEKAGADIPSLFSSEGEEGFRYRESQALQELASRAGTIVATGGGIVINPANRDLMRRTGTVVYLRARPQTIWRRLPLDGDRPLLAVANPRAEIERLLGQREPMYQAAADYVVDTDGLSPDEVAQGLLDLLSTAGIIECFK